MSRSLGQKEQNCKSKSKILQETLTLVSTEDFSPVYFFGACLSSLKKVEKPSIARFRGWSNIAGTEWMALGKD